MYSKYIPLEIRPRVQSTDRECCSKVSELDNFGELHIIKFNLFTALCVARLTGNRGRKLLLGLNISNTY